MKDLGASESTSRSLCTFFVGGLCLGVEVATMREVLRAQSLTRVPRAPKEVRGLMNLRGQIVTAIDLGQKLQIPAAESRRPATNVIVQTSDGPVSLLVDEIGDVVDVEDALAEPPPAHLPASVRDLITHVYKTRDNLLLLLNVDRTAALDG